jgi:B12-binding domain/radical SAM domain protein
MAGRKRPAYRNPKLLAKDIFNIADHLNAPVMIIGDIFQPGEDYAFTFLQEMKEKPVSNHIAFEFFVPPTRHQLETIAESIPNFNIEISPESHDEEIRRAFGRPYDNSSLERMIHDAIEFGCKRIDVFFMTGLPKQTAQSVLDTVDYCRSLLGQVHPYRRLLPFISPLAPFLDPGSMVFEEPENYGYRLLHKTVEEHRKALLAPSWKYILNYETQWMTRDEIVYSTYEAGKRLNRLKVDLGLIDAKTAESVEQRIEMAVQMMKEIDRIVALSGLNEKDIDWGGALQGRLSLETYSMSTVCGKKELEWPTRFLRMNLFKIVKTILTRRKPNVTLPSPTASS